MPAASRTDGTVYIATVTFAGGATKTGFEASGDAWGGCTTWPSLRVEAENKELDGHTHGDEQRLDDGPGHEADHVVRALVLQREQPNWNGFVAERPSVQLCMC